MPTAADERRFPIQGTWRRGYGTTPPGSVPWSVGLAAWERYAARFGRNQSAERIAERGGFGHGEMDMFADPGWRQHFEAHQ